VSTATWEGGRLRQRDSEWLETGDLAAVDEQGNLIYRGRKKDVIVTSSGLNIYPEDLEAALEAQPQVRACAVVQTEGRSGPEPLAALVVRDDANAAEAVRAANRGLADYQHIRRWVVWPEPDLPRTSTGKVLRREVARRIAGLQNDGAGSTQQGALEAILHRITGADVSKLGDDASLSEDLHLDSLGRVELQSTIEMQWGLEIDDAEWQQINTLGQLRRRLQEAASPTATESRPVERDPPDIYPEWTWHPAQQWIRTLFIETVMRLFVWFLAAPKVKRAIHREPAQRVLIVSNHVTAYDAALILYALPGRMRERVAIAMGAELVLDMRLGRNQGGWLADLLAPFGYFLITAWFNVFPLPQRRGFRESFAFAARAIDRGYHVLVFPEGRRTRDSAMHEFRTGAGLLWNELRCDALPVFIEGLAELKARHSGWFRSGQIEVCIGNVIPYDPGRDHATAAHVLEEHVRRVCADAARGEQR
jgi:long-chain acyl-CoA synthetase